MIGQPGGRQPAPSPLDLVQDFVNTEIPDWHVDELSTPEQLRGWLVQRSLLRDRALVGAEAFLLARDLRGALRELALANTVGPPAGSRRARLDASLARIPLRLGAGQGGRPVLIPTGDAVERALGALLVIVLDAERDGTWPRMKACRQETCHWLFYDHSRNRSGSWCSMSICGNRTKTRRYRQRRQSG